MSDQIDYDDIEPDAVIGDAVERLWQRIRFGLRWRKYAYLKCTTTRFDPVVGSPSGPLWLMVFCDRWRGHRGEHRDR